MKERERERREWRDASNSLDVEKLNLLSQPRPPPHHHPQQNSAASPRCTVARCARRGSKTIRRSSRCTSRAQGTTRRWRRVRRCFFYFEQVSFPFFLSRDHPSRSSVPLFFRIQYKLTIILYQTKPTNRPGLHDMRVKADREKEEAAATKKAVAAIDKAAAAQYERDRAAAEAARKALGSWVSDRRGARAR